LRVTKAATGARCLVILTIGLPLVRLPGKVCILLTWPTTKSVTLNDGANR
jgi:hypothetical protein